MPFLRCVCSPYVIQPAYDNIMAVMVKSRLFSSTQNTVISAAFVLALAYGGSAVLGLIRSRLLSTFFGDGVDLSVFYIADRIPSLIYSILAVGALSSVFIPVFSYEITKSKAGAFKTASNIVSLCLEIFILFSLVVFMFSPQIIDALSAGKFSYYQVRMGAALMRLMLAAQMILLVSSFLGCILQSFRYFLVPALAPIFYNVGMIGGLVLFTARFGIYAAALGGLLGSVLHFAVQAIFIGRTGFTYSFGVDFKDKASLTMVKLLPPRILSLAASQISITITNFLAVLVSTGSVIYIRFADQLQSFPVNFFGASIALAALPSLSSESGQEDSETFRKTFITSFFQMMFLAVPASVIIIILRVPAVRLVYGASRFPWDATLQTALLLGIFGVSVFSQGAVLLLNRAFYALKNTKTPLGVSLISICTTTLFSFVAVKYLGLGAWAIAAAITLGSFIDFILLLAILQKHIGKLGFSDFYTPFLKIALSALAMGSSIYIPLKLLDIRVFDTTRTIELLALTAVVTLSGMASYLFFTRMLHVKEIDLLYKLLAKLKLTKVLSPQTPILVTPEEPDLL